ncbi:MAG: Tim44 domain-containing protein, partial [Acetobacteraceae bacterium]|nr:Tim44 domain-containing protein [Acetobacteraceae bacterium]MBV8589833.1 Tim44 domain-containing protein [Acetobacteraceae bacterium]
MRRTSVLIAVLAALALALTPSLADARAGGGGSMGSRGSRTWSAPPPTNTAPFAAPMQRSITPRSAPTYGSPGFMGAPGYQPRSAFTSGLLGGLIGAGLGGLLLGHGFFGGISGLGSFLGFLLQILLIVLVVRWLMRRFRGSSQPAYAGWPNLFARSASAPPYPARGGGAGPAAAPVAIGPADYAAFEQALKDIQAAWSARDIGGLQRLATPEMVSYFNEQLAERSSRGLYNTVSDVRLLKGDLSEAWREGDREYATVAMQFSMVDVTRDASGRVVEGDPTRP